MNVVSLSDEDNRAIFAGRFSRSLGNLDRGTQQKEVLKKIHQVLDSDSPDYYIYEEPTGVDVLQIIRPNDLLRIYCKLIMGVPDHAKTYNLLYVFYVDKHKYQYEKLHRWDEKAKSELEHIRSLQSVGDVERYLEKVDALSADDIMKLIEEGSESFS